MEHRPGLNGHYFAADWHVFFHINWSVNHVIPDGRIVGPIDDIDLHLDCAGQRRIALVLGHRLEFVGLALLFFFN